MKLGERIVNGILYAQLVGFVKEVGDIFQF